MRNCPFDIFETEVGCLETLQTANISNPSYPRARSFCSVGPTCPFNINNGLYRSSSLKIATSLLFLFSLFL